MDKISLRRRVAIGVVIPLMVNCASGQALAAEKPEHLQLAYVANLASGSYDSSLDRLDIGPLQPGHSQVAGSNPEWMPAPGAVTLAITRPAQYTGGPVAAGLWATPVDFGQGSIFGMRATFISPAGPHQTGNIWAVTIAARTGDADDFFPETRVAVTLQVRGDGARLNVPGAAVAPNLPNLPQAVYDAIFDATDPQPFTLEAVIDRVTGVGRASLQVGETKVTHEFQFLAFKPDSGPAITAIGPTIAIANAAGQSASVRVRNFEMLLPKGEDANPAATGCPPGWAEFNCRTVAN